MAIDSPLSERGGGEIWYNAQNRRNASGGIGIWQETAIISDE